MDRRFQFGLTYSILVLVYLPCAWSFRVPLLSEELGCSPTLSFFLRTSTNEKPSNAKNKLNSLYYFDPFNLGTDLNFSRYREAEYKHGRVAMLAMTEIIAMPIIKRFLSLPRLWSSSTSSGDFTSSSFLPPDHAIVPYLQKLQFNNIFPVLITCGILEGFIFVQQDAKDMPGDYGIGYYGLRNKGLHEQELIIELEHGRLAMVSFVLYMLLETTTSVYQDTSWLDQWIRFIGSISLPQ